MRRDPVQTEYARELRRNANGAEQRLWSFLRGKRLAGYKFRRQYPIGNYIADFACISARLVIEVDGNTHGNDQRETLDGKRTEYIEKLGYRVIRFWNDQVFNATDGVIESILDALGTNTALSPSP